MENLLQDLRFAIRTLAKKPVFTVVVVVTIGLGVGANAAMFSIVYGVLFRILPFENPAELVRIYQSDRLNSTQRESVSGPDYFDYVEQQTVFESMAAFTGLNPTLSDGLSNPDRLTAAQATHSLFETLGRGPTVGRGFLPDDDVPGGPRVAVLSHGLWTIRFGADAGVIGRPIDLDEVAYTVIGVMPAGFEFLPNVQVWLPLQYTATTGNRGVHNLGVVARLRDGESISTAQAEMTRIMSGLEDRYPADNIGRGATVDLLEFSIVGAVRPALLLLMGAVVLVLFIGCANVANLMLTRGAARQREIAVRTALGAGSRRIAGQLMAESMTLAVTGGALGVLLAFAGIRLLHVLNPGALPRLNEVTLNPAVLGFTLFATILTGLAFGVLPAHQATRTNLSIALSDGGRTGGGVKSGRLQSAMATGQIALAFVLVVGAGLLLKSMWRLSQVDPGFRYGDLVRLSVSLPPARYPSNFQNWPEAPEVKAFYDDVLGRAHRLPFVTSAALAVNDPTNPGWTSRVAIEGRGMTVEDGVEEERIRPVGVGYFETIGTTRRAGRTFNPFDRGDSPPVVVVNQSFVNKYFPGEDPLQKRIRFWGTFREIVGVVSDVSFMGLSSPPRPAVYAPMSQLPFGGFDIVVRSSAPSDQVISAMRSEILQIDPQLAVYNVATFKSMLSQSLSPQRFNMIMMGLFALLALSLAAVGMYGVISYGVSRRVHEFGVRMSLGADRARVSRLVLSECLKLTLAGIGIGLTASIALSGLVTGLLFNVAAVDLVMLVGVALFIAAVALIASLVPALHASRVDPMVALRQV